MTPRFFYYYNASIRRRPSSLRRLRIRAQRCRLRLRDRPDAKDKIDNMAHPDDCENDAGHQQPLAHHEKEANRHEHRHRREDTGLGTHGHALFLHEGIKMLFGNGVKLERIAGKF